MTSAQSLVIRRRNFLEESLLRLLNCGHEMFCSFIRVGVLTVEMESLPLATPLSRLVTVIPNEGLFNPLKRLSTLGEGDYFVI